MGVYIPNISLPKEGEVLMIDIGDNGLCDAEYWDRSKVVSKQEYLRAIEIPDPCRTLINKNTTALNTGEVATIIETDVNIPVEAGVNI